MKIGKNEIGGGNPVFIVAEIGCNHNGDLELAKKLIAAAKQAGCDAVKFQKRTVEAIYSEKELSEPCDSPFGSTYGDLMRGMELSFEAYQEIDRFCGEQDIVWFASPWDEGAAEFLERLNVPCYKIAAATLTDAGLLNAVRDTGKPVLLSTGMSGLDEIDRAINILGRDRLVLLHCVSQYPASPENINLRAMRTLAELYHVPAGYSGHELGNVISAVAVGMGACVVERHFTIDNGLWGSDHKASLDPDGMKALVGNIRMVEKAMGDPIPRCLSVELPEKEKSRRVNSI